MSLPHGGSRGASCCLTAEYSRRGESCKSRLPSKSKGVFPDFPRNPREFLENIPEIGGRCWRIFPEILGGRKQRKGAFRQSVCPDRPVGMVGCGGLSCLSALLEAHGADVCPGVSELGGVEPELIDVAVPEGVSGEVEGVGVPFAVLDGGGGDGGVEGDDEIG